MDNVDFNILDEARLRYDISVESESLGWTIKLMDRDGNLVLDSKNDTFRNVVMSLKVFLDSKEEIHRLEDEIKISKLKRDIEEYDLERKLEVSKNRLKYSDKVDVPTKVLSKEYVSCDFCTYGKCPTCGSSVSYGMGRSDEECPNCTQKLLW